MADDVGAVVQAMRATKQFRQVGVIGHSEGPMLAARYAAGHPGMIDFIVSLASVGVPGGDLVLLQDRMQAADNGADPAAVARLMSYGLLALIPYVNIGVAIWLGIKGREMAWKNASWESVEHFNRVQKKWSQWAVGILVGALLIGVIAAVAGSGYQEPSQRARQSQL